MIAAVVGGALVRLRPRRYLISERSMVPALSPGDFTVALRTSELRRGDVVVFEHPVGSRFEVVKRVIGLAGEMLEIGGGGVFVDGRELDEPWTAEPTGPSGNWRLGPGELFLLGDARTISLSDSRTIGPVPAARCRYRLVLRYWPPGRLGRI